MSTPVRTENSIFQSTFVNETPFLIIDWIGGTSGRELNPYRTKTSILAPCNVLTITAGGLLYLL